MHPMPDGVLEFRLIRAIGLYLAPPMLHFNIRIYTRLGICVMLHSKAHSATPRPVLVHQPQLAPAARSRERGSLNNSRNLKGKFSKISSEKTIKINQNLFFSFFNYRLYHCSAMKLPLIVDNKKCNSFATQSKSISCSITTLGIIKWSECKSTSVSAASSPQRDETRSSPKKVPHLCCNYSLAAGAPLSALRSRRGGQKSRAEVHYFPAGLDCRPPTRSAFPLSPPPPPPVS